MVLLAQKWTPRGSHEEEHNYFNPKSHVVTKDEQIIKGQRESKAVLTQSQRTQGLENCPWGILNFVHRSQTESSVPYRNTQ